MRMSFDWSHYLVLANDLSKCERADPLAEAKQRCAVSRAYYSVFIRARNLLRRKDHVYVPRDRTHQFVIEQFRGAPIAERQEIGDHLQELLKYRTNADYDDSIPQLAWFVELVLKMAADTEDLLKRV